MMAVQSEKDDIERNMRAIFGEDSQMEDFEMRRPVRVRNDSGVSSASASTSTITPTYSDSGSDSEESSSTVSSEETDEDELVVEEAESPEWVVESPVTMEEFPVPPAPGIKIPHSATMTPFEYFKILFNTNFLIELASWINGHASIVKARPHRDQSRVKNWQETNAAELLIFLGILFFMGTVRINKINNYWKKHYLYKFSLGNYMSRNRFLLILRMLYFTGQDVAQNIYSAVDPFINYFNKLMGEIVYPVKELVIDESLVLWRGKLKIRQYIKNKRHKFGIKLYMLGDPQGLIHRVHMYKGSADREVGGTGHVDKVVMKLIQDYLNVGHALYIDNFYSSIGLAESLLSQKTYCTGTLLSNRKRNPSLVTTKKLKKGDSIHRYNRQGVCVLKWKDKRDVLSISTEYPHGMTFVVNRRGQTVSKPVMIVNYNKFMKGVDRHDQMLAYYPCDHKTVRWFKRVGINLIQTMLINSYFLYKMGTGKSIRLDEFREDILKALLVPPTPQAPAFPTHMPKELDRNDDGVFKRRRCARHWTVEKKRKTTNMFCPDCNVGLCLQCYGAYHIENGLLK